MNTPKAQHTPGPWRRDAHNANLVTAETENVKGMGIVICNVVNAHIEETQAANARLIASAPALLEALRAILAGLTQRVQFSPHAESMEGLKRQIDVLRCDAEFAIQTASKALTQATGQ